MKSLAIFSFLFVFMVSFSIAQEIYVDSRDGQTYSMVQIGTQVWMGENMNYNPGEGSWCPENAPELCGEYGRLYSFEVAKNVCPKGWHLPTDAEFQTLADYLGGEEVAGNKLKERGVDHWSETILSVTNASGFSARGSGNYWDEGDFDEVGEWVTFWSSTTIFDSETEREYVWGWTLYADDPIFERDTEDPTMGLSVRCIKN